MNSQTGSRPDQPLRETPLPETLRLRSRGVVTLPKKLREKYDLGEGEALRLVDLGGVFAITPMRPMVPELAREIERMRTEAGLSTEDLLESLRAERRRTYAERYAGDLKRFAEEAFDVYQDKANQSEAERWRWRLFRPGGPGEVLAVSPRSYPEQSGAEGALAAFKEHVQSARLEITQADAARGEAGVFGWRLLVPNSGEVLAVGGALGGASPASAEKARRAAQRAQRIAMAAGPLAGSPTDK